MQEYIIRRSRFNARGIVKGLILGVILYLVIEWIGAYQMWHELDMKYPNGVSAKESSEEDQVNETNLGKRQIEEIKPVRDQGYLKYIKSLRLDNELESWLLRVIDCESSGNSRSVNRIPIVYTYNGKLIEEHATGLGQFLPST